MTDFSSRLTRSPIAYDADAGADIADQFQGLAPELRELLVGAAGCSPFLKSLIARDEAWLREALEGSPEAAVKAALAALVPDKPAAVNSALRLAKRRVALIAALADLGGVWTLEEVTRALTQLADAATHRAFATQLAEEIRRGKLPSATPGDEEHGAGMAVFAMGKMGAFELNYSSDIDLICLFDESQFDPSDWQDARQSFIRATRKAAAMLNDRTVEGYVFRTDLRLRPDASVTPVCISMEAAERYYESLGRTWERAAWIKARPCAGDLKAGAKFLEVLRPFVWRRHLDYAAIQDAHDMRLRIREHKGLGGAIALEGHDMKLGQGGIREIEFFTQTRQLISGGRDPDLRCSDTVSGLAALAQKEWITDEVAQALTYHYRAHREVEHRLQMVNDAQTQLLPNSDEGFDRLARFMGEGDTARFKDNLLGRIVEVAALTEAFFAPSDAVPMPDLTEQQAGIVEGWRSYAALRSERAQEIFRRLRPDLLTRLLAAPHPDEAIIGFDRFLAGLPAGVQLFSLFEANPTLIDLLIDILTTSPVLGAYLARNSAVFDAVIGGTFFDDWPGGAELLQGLQDRLEAADDYERRLDAARIWHKEWHFRIGVHQLRGLIDAFQAARQYAELADIAITALWPHVTAEFARKHGPQPGRGAALLAMGSLGSGRLSAGSDLDLIAIYDAGGEEMSDGPRPLAARVYFSRLTQAMVTALSAQTARGRLYEVDMRLRPSGRKGPVATSIEAFKLYQRDEAWTWEHLAMTRARPVAGDAGLCHEIETFRAELLGEKSQGSSVLQDVADMRARLQSAKPAQGNLDAKQGAGRLQDIELLAQTCALRAGSTARRPEAQILAGRRAGVISAQDEAALSSAYRLLWRIQCSMRLIGDATAQSEAMGEGAQSFVLRECGVSDIDALIAQLDNATAQVGQIIETVLAGSD